MAGYRRGWELPGREICAGADCSKIIEQRHALGLSQQELARLAGVRQETISRLESGKHSPTIRTADKIDAGLLRAEQRRKKNG